MGAVDSKEEITDQDNVAGEPTEKVTVQSDVAVGGTKKKTPKIQQPEKWEIQKIGCFLLKLYHQQLLSPRNNWLINKGIMRQEFKKFLNEPGNETYRLKFEEAKIDVGTMLNRTYFLKNTERGSDYYCIKNVLGFHDRAIKEKDEERKKHGMTLNELNLEVLATNESPIIPLIYQGSEMQTRNANYRPEKYSCLICQCNFSLADKYTEHMEYHNDATEFEYVKKLTKFDTHIINLSYKPSTNIRYLCFYIECNVPNIVIDKVIIMQRNSMYDLPKYSNGYLLPNDNRDSFYVESKLLTNNLENPIIVIFHDKYKEDMRIVEQHNFVREQKLNEAYFEHDSNNKSNMSYKKVFKGNVKLPRYLPTEKMISAMKCGYPIKELTEISHEFADYVNNGKTLTLHNIHGALNILLQIEDLGLLRNCLSLLQRNVTIRSCEKQYSFMLKLPNSISIDNLIHPFDEVHIVKEYNSTNEELKEPTLDLLLKNMEDFSLTFKQYKSTYFGYVDRISDNRITFISNQTLPAGKKFMVLILPSRLTLLYQYRALEMLLSKGIGDLTRFFFPQFVAPRDIPSACLILQNELIYKNAEQLEAVQNIVDGPHRDATYIIVGPPGTGKSAIIVESVIQLYVRRPNTTILVTASSNSACDEIGVRLCKTFAKMGKEDVVARIYSQACAKYRSNVDELLLKSSNMSANHFYPSIDTLHKYRVVICTISVVAGLGTGGFGKDSKGQSIFTHVFVDDATFPTEAETLMAFGDTLLSQTSLILAGDLKMSNPRLNSERAKELGLGNSLMQRLLARECYRLDDEGKYNRSIQTRLYRNYRSHPEIVNLFSRLFYDNKILAMARSGEVLMCENWHRAPNSCYPIIFHSIFGTSEFEDKLSDFKELDAVMDYLKDLMYFGVKGEKISETDIGIITSNPTQLQRIQDEVNLRNWYKMDIGTVEDFQGKEKSIIIVSVTSNWEYLNNSQHLNLMFSRAKSLLIIVGNPKTLSINSDFKHLIDECIANNTIIGMAPSSRKNDGDKKKQFAKCNEQFRENPLGHAKDKPKKVQSTKGKGAPKLCSESESDCVDSDATSQAESCKDSEKHPKPKRNKNYKPKTKNVEGGIFGGSEMKNLNKEEIQKLVSLLPRIVDSSTKSEFPKKPKGKIQDTKPTQTKKDGAKPSNNLKQYENQISELVNQLKLTTSKKPNEINKSAIIPKKSKQEQRGGNPSATGSRTQRKNNPNSNQSHQPPPYSEVFGASAAQVNRPDNPYVVPQQPISVPVQSVSSSPASQGTLPVNQNIYYITAPPPPGHIVAGGPYHQIPPQAGYLPQQYPQQQYQPQQYPQPPPQLYQYPNVPQPQQQQPRKQQRPPRQNQKK